MVREETAVRQEVRSADGTMIPVWISGSGRPIVIVHGAVSDHSAFDLLRERLETRLTVAAMDRRPTFTDPFSRHSIVSGTARRLSRGARRTDTRLPSPRIGGTGPLCAPARHRSACRCDLEVR
jgi:hypothetical protein